MQISLNSLFEPTQGQYDTKSPTSSQGVGVALPADACTSTPNFSKFTSLKRYVASYVRMYIRTYVCMCYDRVRPSLEICIVCVNGLGTLRTLEPTMVAIQNQFQNVSNPKINVGTVYLNSAHVSH